MYQFTVQDTITRLKLSMKNAQTYIWDQDFHTTLFSICSVFFSSCLFYLKHPTNWPKKGGKKDIMLRREEKQN